MVIRKLFSAEGNSRENGFLKDNESPNQKNCNPKNTKLGDVVNMFNSGDQGAFDYVYRELYPHVFYFACRFVSRDDAADIASDAFMKLLEKEKDFASIQKIRIFLQVCVRNACITLLATRRRHQSKSEDIARLQDELQVIQFDDKQAKAEILKRIYLEIERLPPRAKEVFKLSVLEGMDSIQIGALLGINKSSVRNQKKRAIEILRMAIGRIEILLLAALNMTLSLTLR